MKTPLEKLLKEGWKEITELGFGRNCVVYEKEKERMLYNWIKEEIILKYDVEK